MRENEGASFRTHLPWGFQASITRLGGTHIGYELVEDGFYTQEAKPKATLSLLSRTMPPVKAADPGGKRSTDDERGSSHLHRVRRSERVGQDSKQGSNKR